MSFLILFLYTLVYPIFLNLFFLDDIDIDMMRWRWRWRWSWRDSKFLFYLFGCSGLYNILFLFFNFFSKERFINICIFKIFLLLLLWFKNNFFNFLIMNMLIFFPLRKYFSDLFMLFCNNGLLMLLIFI